MIRASSLLCVSLLVAALGLSRPAMGVEMLSPNAPAGNVSFRGCYASWTGAGLTVGNTNFEAVWILQDDRLQPVSFRLKNPDYEWLQPPTNQSPEVGGGLKIGCYAGCFGTIEQESLKLEITITGDSNALEEIQLFRGLSGALIGQKSEDIKIGGLDDLLLLPQHLRLTQVNLVDQTDTHNELASEREWLPSPSEAAIPISENLIYVEDVLGDSGLVFLKLAPLPSSRPVKTDVDFSLAPRSRTIKVAPTDYPVAMMAYRGGRLGRIIALQNFQRQLRAPVPNRDGVFLINTWGDRNRDSRINEAFIDREIVAGAALGADVIQIDDGWQKGRTKNTAKAGGVWSGWWAADPQFWNPDPHRFPNGLQPVARESAAHGIGLGLWFAPDSSQDATNWERDANRILELYHDYGIDYFKIDSLKTTSSLGLENQHRLFDRVLQSSDGRIVFDLDVTADVRPGYFSLPEMGPIFVENRYTDTGTYWPHQTLRNLWKLSQYIDPVRLRMEFLNNTRNAALYGDDPLAPSRYRPDTLFATVMVASPLGWFEASSLPPEFATDVAPLVALWKRERARLQAGNTIPVGQAPDGMAWTGFANLSSNDSGGYVLLFRELNESPDFSLDRNDMFPGNASIKVLAGRGTAALDHGRLKVSIPAKLDYIWVRLDVSQSSTKDEAKNE